MTHTIQGNVIRVEQKEATYLIEACTGLVAHLSDPGCTCQVYINPFIQTTVYLTGSDNCPAHGHKYELVKDMAVIKKVDNGL